jgi:RNA polymerase-binding transcription factor DksA
MRHQFHRCRHLRVIALRASDLSGERRGGRAVVEELCEAKSFTPCLGLVECDILPLSQKRELLATRATRMREEEGITPLSGVPRVRSALLGELRESLLSERERIVGENRAMEREIASLVEVGGRGEVTDEEERARAGESIRLEDAIERLTVRRLDAIDRALDEMAWGTYGLCAACEAPIDVKRLRAVPDTRVCISCARKGALGG